MKTDFSVDPFLNTTLFSTQVATCRFMYLKPNTSPICGCHQKKKRHLIHSTQWFTHVTKKGKYSKFSCIIWQLVPTPWMAVWLLIEHWHLLNAMGAFSLAVWNTTMKINLLSGATFAYLCYTTQQNMGHLKRLVFNFQSVWEHEWAFMARAIMPRCPHCSFPEMLFLVTEKCHLFVLQSNPWWKVPLLWYYMFCPRKKYLFGHIKIILENFSTLLAYFRKIKKQIYPPQGLFFPNIWTG